MASKNKNNVVASEEQKESAVERRNKAKKGAIAGYDVPVEVVEPVAEPAIELELIIEPEVVDEPVIEPEVLEVDEGIDMTKENVESLTVFQKAVKSATENTVTYIDGFFPMIANDNGTVSFTGDATQYNFGSGFQKGFYALVCAALVKIEGNERFNYANLSKLAGQALVDVLNEAEKLAKRNFDRQPPIVMVANGNFDGHEVKNRLVGMVKKFNIQPHSEILEIVDEYGLSGRVTGFANTLEYMALYLSIGDDTQDKDIFVKIMNGSSGRYSLNYSTVMKLGDVEFNFTESSRNRHLSKKDETKNRLFEAVTELGKYNYREVLSGSETFNEAFASFEDTLNRMINKTWDAEKASATLLLLRTKCLSANYDNAFQILNEAAIMCNSHGHKKYLTEMAQNYLDKKFNL